MDNAHSRRCSSQDYAQDVLLQQRFWRQNGIPLIALFLGTGNQTANVSCAILERLFDDSSMKLWDYDPDALLPNLPTMVTFPNLHNFYEDWRKDLESKGVDIRETSLAAIGLCIIRSRTSRSRGRSR